MLFPFLAFITSISFSDIGTVHRAYKVVNLQPPGMEFAVGGIDFLSDGRMVICDWGKENVEYGKVYILENVLGNANIDSVKVKQFAEKLREPLGLAVVHDSIYVLGKDGLYFLPDSNKDDRVDAKRMVVTGWPWIGGREYAFGLRYKDGAFYGALATQIPPNADPWYNASADHQGVERGTFIKMDTKTGNYEVIAGGLRAPNGVGNGPDGDFFLTDNQGNWLPANKLICIRKDAFYGMHADIESRYNATEKVETPPAVWIQEGEIGRSPSEPILVKYGPFTGQMFVGDVVFGGIQRIALEKVNNQWQGAIFRFTGGFSGGVNRLAWGPDSCLYVGQIGEEGTAFNGDFFGLSKLVYTGDKEFEIFDIKATEGGFDLRFTESIDATGVTAGSFLVKSWRNESQETYGGGAKLDSRTNEIADVKLSDDRKTVHLKIIGFEKGRVYHIRPTVISRDGDALGMAKEGWYTLNEIPDFAMGISITGKAGHRSKIESSIQAFFELSKRNPGYILGRKFSRGISLPQSH